MDEVTSNDTEVIVEADVDEGMNADEPGPEDEPDEDEG